MDNFGLSETQMPKYKCHKEVWALKIKEVRREEPPLFKGAVCRGAAVFGTACGHCEKCLWYESHGEILRTFMFPVDERFAPIEMDSNYLSRNRPESGGYFVVYEDGYKSYSPAAAFESGYTEIK